MDGAVFVESDGLMHLPLHEFDPNPIAVINPAHDRRSVSLPRIGVLCWFGDVVRERMVEQEVVYNIHFEHGPHPVVVVEHNGVEVALACPGVGAPIAAGSLEMFIADDAPPSSASVAQASSGRDSMSGMW